MARFSLSDPAVRYAVIGDPVAHSLSPAMQNAGLAALGRPERYGLFHVLEADLPAFAEFARKNLAGFNITVPHKQAIIPLLDAVSPEAAAVGSVNTVTVRDGKLYGDSTDGYGLLTALAEAFGFHPEGGTVLLLGAGGAAQAVAGDLVRHGVRKLVIANRTVARAETLAAQYAAAGVKTEAVALNDEAGLRRVVPEADVVIQATSAGLRRDDPPPVALEVLRDARGIFDMIYHETAVQRFARERSIPCADGRGMLLHQGAKSLSIWLGAPAPLAAMKEALDGAIARRARGE